MKNFAEWKPHVWNSIKADYGFHSHEEEDDDDLLDFSLSSLGLEVLQPNTSSNTSAKRSVKGSEAKLDKILEMLNAEEEKKKLTEVFKCLVYRETSSNVMFSCATGCGRLLGCFKCLFQIENCPLCRKDLPCVTERKPLLIPGIAALLGVPEISLKSALKEAGAIPDENSGDSDLELEESLPLSSSRRVGVERSDQPN